MRNAFEQKFIPEPNSGCWIWTASIWGRNNYGAFRHMNAHRAAWSIYRGPIPYGYNVLHKCDVPLCVNPDHLFLGSQKDNMDDAYTKGRRLKSLSNIHAPKLTKAIVNDIRNSQESSSFFQRKYGLSQPLVSMVRCGKRGNNLLD